MFNLRQFDLWAWATYTDTQKVTMLLGSIPSKLDRQHEKAWILLTSPTCTQVIYSIQSHSRLTQLPVLPSTSPPATILSSSPPDNIHMRMGCGGSSLGTKHQALSLSSERSFGSRHFNGDSQCKFSLRIMYFSSFPSFFLSWGSKTQPNHWTKRMAAHLFLKVCVALFYY